MSAQPQPPSLAAGVSPAEESPDDLDEESCRTRVLAVLPDVEPEHLKTLVVANIAEHGTAATERVIETLLDDETYPRVDVSTKRKRTDDDADGELWLTTKYVKIDYGDHERPFLGGVHYAELALAQLQTEFPYVHKPSLRKALKEHNGLYAPTYIFLVEEELLYHTSEGQDNSLLYPRRKTGFRAKGKKPALYDTAFYREISWMHDVYGDKKPDDRELDSEDFECGCCFTSFKLKEMVQCPNAHLFCRECVATHASSRIGVHDPDIKCMDTSGCARMFAVYELYQVLPPKLLSQFERISQRKEVLAAGLEGLEECPFCEWACVIESKEEKLLRCGNEEACGVVSCRNCKHVDHLPRACEEVHGDGRRTVEEAMSNALVHKCPSCKKSFIKETGCNHMVCPCGASSCYACRKLMRYHVDILCPRNGLATASLHREDVSAAKSHAIKEYTKKHPEVDVKLLEVEVSS